MASSALFLFGVALALLIAAAPQELVVLAGPGAGGTAIGVLGFCLGALAAFPLCRLRPVKSRSAVLLLLVGFAACCFAAPYWIDAAGELLLRSGKPAAGRLATLLAALCALGPPGMVAMLTLDALVRHPGEHRARADAGRVGAALLGGGVGLILGPELADLALGLAGAVRGAAMLAVATAALVLMTPAAPPGAAPAGGTRFAPLLAALALGAAAGQLLARIDPALSGTETAAVLGPALFLFAGGIGLLLAAGSGRLAGSGLVLAIAAALLLAAARLVPDPAAILASARAVGAAAFEATDEHLAEPRALLGSFCAIAFALALLLACGGAGRSTSGLLPCLAVAGAAAALARIAPHDARVAVSMVAAAALALATGAYLRFRSDGGTVRRRAVLAGGAGGLVAAALLVPVPAGSTDWDFPDTAGVVFEPDGSQFAEQVAPDGRRSAFVDGIPVSEIPTNRGALRRTLLIALAQIESPNRLLVLGPGGEPLVRALLQIQTAPVTWVTPLAGEVRQFATTIVPGSPIRLIRCHERAFLERTEEPFDLVFLTPPATPVRRNGFLLTTQFLRRLEARLGPDGRAAWILPLESLDPGALLNEYLPAWTAALPDFALFLDHPRNPQPWLTLIAGPDRFEIRPERITRRVAELAATSPELADAGLDARGIPLCFLTDRAALRLGIRLPWNNDDMRPRLAMTLQPPPPLEAGFCDDTLAVLITCRSSIEDRLEFGSMPAPEARALVLRLRRDYGAVTHLLTGTRALAASGVRDRDPGAETEVFTAEAGHLWLAARRAPRLALVRRPLEVAIAAMLARRDFEPAIDLIRQLYYLQGLDPDLRLRVADLERRIGRVTGAEIGYREVVQKYPDRADAHLRLGCLLAGMGRELRAPAVSHLEQALALESLPAADQIRAWIVLAFVTGDDAAARTVLAEQNESDDDALLRFIRERVGR